MIRQSLNGRWSYETARGEREEITVPFSLTPVGRSIVGRHFSLDEKSGRYFLFFEGITYAARVFLNSKLLGEMLPYCEYRFEITDIVESENELVVELDDIEPKFGPSAGWGNYGGIIRGVYLENSEAEYIKDVFFHSELENDYRDAKFIVEVEVDGKTYDEVEVELRYDGKTVDKYTVLHKDSWRKITGVSLWSPDEPNLYELTVTLKKDGRIIDEYFKKVGFREFKCSKHRFILNGKELFLQGVCRHEVMDDYGHTVPEEIVKNELAEIKRTGCNFVRFVHYPHSKRAVELADELGIMISEEPGLWWSDTSDPEISAGSLEVLRRTILRDRNSPSIMFWLCFNECKFTEQFLIDSARVCRETDPTRLVSGANCMSDDDTLKYYNICGFDFYTQHPYSPTVDRAVEAAKKLNDKPLMFTEWGGYDLYDNPALLKRFISRFYELYLQNDSEGALAGASFWYWSEGFDYNRGKPFCVDGRLKESLKTGDGKKTLIYDAFVDGFKEAKNPVKAEELYEYISLDELEGKKAALCDAVTDLEALRVKAEERMKPGVERLRHRKITVGPILQKEEIKGISLVPYLLKDNLTFTLNAKSDCLTIIGATSLRKGYPLSGDYGETVALLTVEFACGETKEIELKNGEHFTTAFTTIASSRINPLASKATAFARFSYDKNFENYIINKLEIPFGEEKSVTAVKISRLNDEYDLLFYGVFA